MRSRIPSADIRAADRRTALIRRVAVVLAIGLASCAEPRSPLSPLTPPAQPLPPGAPSPPAQPPTAPAPPIAAVPRIVLAQASGAVYLDLARGESPAWSPARGRIAYSRQGRLFLFDLTPFDGGEVDLGVGHSPAWSPDGRRLAFVDDQGIRLVDPDGGAGGLLVRHDFRDDTYAEWDMGVDGPDWSPDGRTIAFEHLGDGDMVPATIFTVPVDGSAPPMRFTNTGRIRYAESAPAWSPDGSRLAFWSYGYGLAVANLADGVPRSVPGGAGVSSYRSNPAWTRDGQSILFTHWRNATESDLLLVPVQAGSATLLIANARDGAWSSDGTRVAVVKPLGR